MHSFISSQAWGKNRLAETPEEVFLPLVRMMTIKLHQSLDQDKQKRFYQFWTLQNSEQKGHRIIFSKQLRDDRY